MFGCCECFYWNQVTDDDDDDDEFYYSEPKPFSLPSPLPKWPPGKGFATNRINLGEIEVIAITKFERIWSSNQMHGKTKGVTFYRPVGIPDGFDCLGHYCQPNCQPLRGYVLVARETNDYHTQVGSQHEPKCLPALVKPLNYSLIWSSVSYNNGNCYFWLPNPPEGYKSMGILVTSELEEPDVEEVKCVRKDLTETCETCNLMISLGSKSRENPFQVWITRPYNRGVFGSGVSVGTFYCSTYLTSDEVQQDFACLKNLDRDFLAMSNLDQIHALIKCCGPTVFFHPDEEYMPSSVKWFFKNGALLYRHGEENGQPIDCEGAILPGGGENDGEFWIDLPVDDMARNFVKRGNIESAELYVHVKPALGGTFTDIAMWVFCPFNGPATLKIGVMTVQMNKIGEHVGDWEHFTLRISNFNGELWQVFFSEHSGGRWLDASELEFTRQNKPIVYSSRHGHASYPHAGTYIQGSTKLGIGARNDTAQSKYVLDSSAKYQLIAAEYLHEEVVTEPCWLQYMREWGPTIVYDSRYEIDKIINSLPFYVRFSVENIIDLFPTELYGEEGPTGPKEKDNWNGDEIC